MTKLLVLDFLNFFNGTIWNSTLPSYTIKLYYLFIIIKICGKLFIKSGKRQRHCSSSSDNYSDTNEEADHEKEQRKKLTIRLTWDEFLKLTTVISNLKKSIIFFNKKKIGINEKNRRVANAAENYLKLLDDFKYRKFMKEVRISFTKI